MDDCTQGIRQDSPQALSRRHAIKRFLPSVTLTFNFLISKLLRQFPDVDMLSPRLSVFELMVGTGQPDRRTDEQTNGV